ncbi:Uncharacterized protein OBRU01_11717, partial [Operophtera brumata]
MFLATMRSQPMGLSGGRRATASATSEAICLRRCIGPPILFLTLCVTLTIARPTYI